MEKKPLSPIIDFKVIKNLVPGTLIYNGRKVEKFAIEVYAYNEEYLDYKAFENFEQFSKYNEEFIKDKNLVSWVNITGISNVDEITKAGRYYDISNLILEQILTITKHSIFKNTSNYIYSDLQMASVVGKKIEVENISIYQQNSVVITFQEKKGDIFDPIRERISDREGFVRNKKSEYLYYSLLDVLVDSYLNVLELVKVEVENAEENIINEEPISIKKIHELRKYIMMLKLNALPLEKVVEVYSKDSSLLNLEDDRFIDNLYEHTKLLSNEVALQKEIVNVLFENYMLHNGNEMNKVMTTLTIFSAIFIPLSFLAGVFGMNFEYIPGLANENGIFYFAIGCIITAISMVSFFKLKKWF